jgi:D-ribose pyranose/furanose isomerase RbsD
MLSNLDKKEVNLSVKEVPAEEVKETLKNNSFTSAVGHQTTSEVLSTLLEIPISTNRISVSLEKGDVLYVFQLLKRIEEGKILSADEIKSLPYKFFKVEIL